MTLINKILSASQKGMVVESHPLFLYDIWIDVR